MINDRLIVITSRKLSKLDLNLLIEEILKAGCKNVILREKDLTEREYEQLVNSFLALFKIYKANLIIHKFLQIAAKYSLPIHLTSKQNVKEARKKLGENIIIGKSCHSFNEAIKAEEEGANYITLGPVFESISKEGYGRKISLEELNKVCKTLKIRVYALGGITPKNLHLCFKSGCYGIAVLGYVVMSENPAERVKELINAISNL